MQSILPAGSEIKPTAKTYKPMNRLTAVVRISRQLDGDDPDSLNGSFDGVLTDDSSTFRETIHLDETGERLTFGRLAGKVGQVFLKNAQKLQLGVNPTDEQKSDHAKHVIGYGVGDGTTHDMQLAPGQSALFCLGESQTIDVRSFHGTTRLLVVAFPK